MPKDGKNGCLNVDLTLPIDAVFAKIVFQRDTNFVHTVSGRQANRAERIGIRDLKDNVRAFKPMTPHRLQI